MKYKVDQIKVVLPDDTRDLSWVVGKDYCTLVTCTPYGVNSHRLLVRGSRIEEETVVDDIEDEPEEASVKTVLMLLLPVLVIMFGISSIIFVIYRRNRFWFHK